MKHKRKKSLNEFARKLVAKINNIKDGERGTNITEEIQKVQLLTSF